MEGKYWKRHNKTIAFEYRRWRRFNTDRIRHALEGGPGRVVEFMDVSIDFGRDMDSRGGRLWEPDDSFMDFTDNFDLMLEEEPLALPTSRDLGNFYGADFVQPGLLPLQPMLEELSVDVVQAVLQTPASAASTSLPTGGRSTASAQPSASQERLTSVAGAGAAKSGSSFLTSLLSQPIGSFDALTMGRGDMQVSLLLTATWMMKVRQLAY